MKKINFIFIFVRQKFIIFYHQVVIIKIIHNVDIRNNHMQGIHDMPFNSLMCILKTNVENTSEN